MIHGRHLNDFDIEMMELKRARHALFFLKSKIDSSLMQSILQKDLSETTSKSEQWVDDSRGKWQCGSMLLTADGIFTEDFHSYFMSLMENNNEQAIRSAHPEHFRNRMLASGPEIIENIGEDSLPWHVFGYFIPVANIPGFRQDESFNIHFGLEVRSVNNKVVAFAGHELKNNGTGMQAKLTIILPSAPDSSLVEGHLNHFTVEFRNWCLSAALNEFQSVTMGKGF